MTKTNSSSLQNIAYKLYKAKNITFIIGAGASISAGIPSAGEIIEIIFQDYPDIKNKILEEDQKDYGKVMGKLTQEQAVKILQSLLNQAQINWGHICLAHLFEHLHNSEKFNILTFNFDNLLERALSVFGYTKPIYDCAVSPIGKDGLKYLAPKAIFHLHGQNYGLRLLNSDEETGEHKEKLRPLFEQKLQIDRPDIILVAGYSGDSDPALTLIQNAMKENTNTELFWLGYSENPSDTLKKAFPEFRNQDQNNKAHYLGGCDFDRTMLRITQEISKIPDKEEGEFKWPPTFFTNTPDHILTLMAQFADYPETLEERDPETLEARLPSLFNLQAFFIERFTNASKDWKNNNYEKENEYLNIILKDEEPEEPDQEKDKHLSPAALILKSYPWEAKNKHLTFQIRQIINKKNAVQIHLECEKHIKNIEAIMGKKYYNIPIARAQLYSAMGEHGKAIEEFEKAENNAPESIEIKCAIALELSSSQKEKDADEKFIEASALGELPPYALANWACALFRLGRFECTIKKFKKAQTQSHKLPIKMLVTWGTACLVLEKYEEAIEKCDEASLKCEQEINLGKNLPQNYSEWGGAYTNLGHSILKFKQDDAKAQDYFQKACSKYEKAINLEAHQPTTLVNWGSALLLSGDIFNTNKQYKKAINKHAKACEKCTESLALDKNQPNTWFNLGNTLSKLGDIAQNLENKQEAQDYYQKACKKYIQAEELGCKEPALYQNWGFILSHLGTIAQSLGKNQESQDYYQKACKKYKRAEELSDKEPSLYLAWGNTLFNLGKIAQSLGKNQESQEYYQNACEKYTQAEELGSKEPNLYNNWGVILSHLGDIAQNSGNKQEAQEYYKDACKKYKRAEELGCKEPDLYNNWGNTLLILGDIAQSSGNKQEAQEYYKDACKKYKRAEALGCKEPALYQNWGNTLLILGLTSLALGNKEKEKSNLLEARYHYQEAKKKGKEALNIAKKNPEIDQNIIKYAQKLKHDANKLLKSLK